MKSRLNEKHAIDKIAKILGYANTSTLSKKSYGPNSLAVLDTKTDRLWKILIPRRNENPHLEEEALDAIPANDFVVKHIESLQVDIDGTQYECLVFPYIHGDPLDKLIIDSRRKGITISPEIIKNVGAEISEAIGFLNNHGLIHQDVKPGNIIIGSDGKIKLIDLGIANFIDFDRKQLKKLEGPYAYLSPEKIRVVSDPIPRNWNQLTFASDIYSLGAVLFEMATLERLSTKVPLAEMRDSCEKLEELGVANDLVSFIRPFLLPSVYDRQDGIGTSFSLDWWTKPDSTVKRLWLHGSKNVVKSIYPSFIQSKANKSPLGLIYQAEQISSEKNFAAVAERGKEFQMHSHLFLLDPSTYLQKFPAKKQRGLKHLPYGNTIIEPGSILQPAAFLTGFPENYVKSVLQFQENLGVDMLISPYFFVDRLNDDWLDANFKVWKIADTQAKNDFGNKKILFGIFISEDLLMSEEEMKELAVLLSHQQFAKTLYLRIESRRPQSQPLNNQSYLKNLRDFISYLSKSKEILLASTGVEGLGLLGFGLEAVSTNPEFSSRKFSMEDKSAEPRDGGNAPKPRLFSRSLLNEFLVQEEVESAFVKGNAALTGLFSCNCSYCPNRDPESLKKHYLHHYDEMFASQISKGDKKEQKGQFDTWVKDARSNYEKFDGVSPQVFELEPASRGSFLRVWESTLVPDEA